MLDDATLLRRYAAGHADDAFAELVRRHLDLVYSAALRQVGGDAHLAQDVAQTVFADLARKAASLAGHPVLAGWLYSSTHYAAAKTVRTEQRRRRREREACVMNDLLHEPADDEAWAQLRPTLDAAMQELKAADRDAILLRFFESQGFAAIGARLSLSENAARMRVERALEKLRAQLARRGVRSTAAALGVALTSHGVAAAPAGAAATITAAALTGVTAGGGAAVGVLSLMTANKLPLAFAATVLIGGSGALVLQQREQTALLKEIAGLHQQSVGIPPSRAEIEALTRAAAEAESRRRDAEALPALRNEVDALRASLAKSSAPLPGRTADASAPRPTASGASAYNLKQLDQMPRSTSQKAPVFPAEFRRLGIPGSAKITFIVGPDGRVQDPEALEPSDELFAAAALEAVKQWTFEPGRKGGQPVATRMTVPIVFAVTDDHTDWF